MAAWAAARAAAAAHRRARPEPGRHRAGPGGQLDLRHQPVDGAGPAERRRAAAERAGGHPAGRPARRAAGRGGPLRHHRPGQHRGRLDRAVRPGRQDLREAHAGAVPRRHHHRLRGRRGGHGAVLLPGRSQGLHRPVLLRHPAPAAGRARRFRPGLRDRPRGGPPCAEPAGHHRQGGGVAGPPGRGPGQCHLGAGGTAGRLPGGCLGPACRGPAALAGPGRSGGGAQRRLAHRRRRAAARRPGPGGARELHPRQQPAAGGLVPARAGPGPHRRLRHLLGAQL
jgi:hypothetical protein